MPSDFDNNDAKGRFSDAQSAIHDGQEKVKKTAEQLQDDFKQGKEQVGQWASTVDRQLRENPWPIVVGVGLGCLILGAILGTKKNNY